MEALEQEEKLYRLSGSSTDGIGGSQTDIPLGELRLLDFIPRIEPFEGELTHYDSPTWLAPGLEMIDRIIAPRDERIYFAYSAPRFHAKTTSIQIAVIKHLIRWPKSKIAYYCHTESLALERSKQIRRTIRALGYEFRDDADTVREWQLDTGAGLLAGPITSAGQGIHPRLVIIDDPYKNAEDARNASYRARVISAIEDDIIPMLPKDGAIILTHSRQHPKDAIGHYKSKLEKDQASKKKTYWFYLNQKALRFDPELEDEVSIGFDAQFPKEKLIELREQNELVFETQYQGEPRTKDGAVFNDPMRFCLDQFLRSPPKRFRVGYGYDCAYTEEQQRRNDWSTIVKMARVPIDEDVNHDLFYVLNVYRRQVGSVEFFAELKRWWKQQRGPMMWLRAGGPEKGVADLARKEFPAARSLAVGGGKGVKATPVSKAWNEGRVLVPDVFVDEFGDTHMPPEWVEGFLEETDAFTGTGHGEIDDQVDALAGAYHALFHSGLITANQPQGHEPPWRAGGSRFADLPGRGYG